MVVLEGDKGIMFSVERKTLPSAIKQGDVLRKCGGRYQIDELMTEQRRKSIQNIMKDLKYL